jgi:periplasmic protein CpxP/Spy
MNRKTILSLAAAFSLAATAAIAGPGGGHHGKWQGHGGHGARFEKQLESLDLTAEQKTKVDEILAAARERNEKDRTALKEGYQKLHAMLDAETPDEKAILDQIETLGELKTEGQKAMMRTMLSVRAELTPEQREALKSQMKERKERMKERREQKKSGGATSKPPAGS